MTFNFKETIRIIQALEEKFNAVKYNEPQSSALKLAYVTALEAEFAECHKLCTETVAEFSRHTTQEVLEVLKKGPEGRTGRCV